LELLTSGAKEKRREEKRRGTLGSKEACVCGLVRKRRRRRRRRRRNSQTRRKEGRKEGRKEALGLFCVWI